MQADIAIVIAAYNRPASLQRLLGSVERARYEGYATIPLIISIDHSGGNDCKELAESFKWKHGNKTVIHHPQNLGLKKHILSCGGFTEHYDAVIVLEDDLFVSPLFFDFAQQAFSFYKNDEQVAGIALYHNTFNEVAYCPFEPLHDGYDNYFMQVPCSWGQLWTKKQWAGFVHYLDELKDDGIEDVLPGNVQEWKDNSSWKKFFYSYLLQSGKYFVYPRVGLSTNFGDAGQHLQQSQTAFQTPLLLAKKTFQFSTPGQSLSLYDGFYELSGEVYNKVVGGQEPVSFDLNGTKPLTLINTKYLISSKQCKKPKEQFAVACYPYENNVLLHISRNGNSDVYFSLGQTTDFSEKQQFSRLPVDLKRVFLTDGFLQDSVRTELEQTKDFRIGHLLLKPFRAIKRIFTSST
jgi:glycosyltransferase involved in cell wall biosynthesis